MATAPVSRRLNLTRDQLAAFLTDQQQIRQFELLFATVDELRVISGTDFEFEAGTAAATANEALAQLVALAQDTAVEDAVLNAKVQQALDAVSQFARTLELIATAPAIQNNNSVVTDYIDFNTTTPSPVAKVGRLHWNGGYTLNLDMTPDVSQSIGEAQYYYIKASAAIAKGQLVMFDGSVGASGVLKGKPSTGVTNGQLIMGVAAEAIANNGFGLVSSFGLVRGFDTTGTPYGEVWADGDILYYNPSFAGGLTKTQPTAPLPHIVVAAVVNAATAGSGSVFVRVQAEPLISQLSDVYAPTPANNDVLIYDAVQQRWENAPISSAGAVTSVTATAPVVSSGGTAPNISMPAANSTTNGYLTSTDWNTFNTRSSTEQEIQTATSGQTVFTLTTMAYTPGTNNLSVFVNGVNQYGPNALYAYTENNSTTVTFTSAVPVGASVKFTTTEFVSSGNNGTVTSVGLSLPSEFTISNSPVTVNGTLTGAWASQTANYVFAAPNGASGTPSFRALTSADIPVLPYVTLTGVETLQNKTLDDTNTVSLKDTLFTLEDEADPTKQAQFQLSGITTGTTRTYTLPNLTGTLATTGTLTQSFSGQTTFSGQFTLSTTTNTLSLGTSQTSGVLNMGGVSQTGTITLGRSTLSQQTDIQAGATASGSTKTINFGTGGVSGSTTNITVGSTFGTTTTVNGQTKIAGSLGRGAPVTKTADFTLADTENWLINNKSGSACVVTLPAASSWVGREVTIKNMQPQLVNSASSNIVPLDSTTAGTAILLDVVGNWATMVSDGTNWIIMQAAVNNNLLLE